MFRRLISNAVLISVLCFLMSNCGFAVDLGDSVIRVPGDYQTIQEAINAANPSDTILVAAGKYSENIFVNKTVSLVGEDQESTVIDMHGGRFANLSATAFDVTADSVSIENLTVTNATKAIWVNQADNVTIRSCRIVSNIWGIWLHNATGCSIQDNFVFDNWGGSIGLFYGGGVDLYNSNNSAIIGNYVSSGNLIAICLDLSHNNKVENNTTIDNNGEGIGLFQANGNTIKNNTLIRDYMTIRSSGSNFIGNNQVLNGGGIGTAEGSENTFCQNMISGCAVGFTMEKAHDFFIGNLIVNCSNGIIIHFSNGSTFYHNLLTNNTENFPEDVYVNFNTFDNGFEGNYWDNYTGIDANHDGIGDTPHTLDDTNMDRYPLIAPINFFDAGTWNNTQQLINVISNSTISNFQLNITNSTLSFTVNGTAPTVGFSRLAIPNIIVQQLWNNNYAILVDNQPANITNNWTDQTNTYIYITYQHSQHQIQIIPELSQYTLLTLLATTATTLMCKRKSRNKRTPATRC